MGVPEVPDRLRRAPTFGLRAVFAGIGRLLLLADRPQANVDEPAPGSRAAVRRSSTSPSPDRSASAGRRAAGGRPAGGRPAGGRPGWPGTPTAEASRWRSLDKTGNVRLLSAEDMDDDEFDEDLGDQFAKEPAEPGEELAGAADFPVLAAVPDLPAAAAEPEDPAAEAAAELDSPAPDAADLPLPNYDELSLASIRARLRSLDTSQLRVLADYERRNAERSDVLGMLERRIEKLEAGA